ncbi:hypothetical protein [Streptomyces sp. AC550_RSS872]|uniref:hypothetical protein n=1 Tax=Streptomyces sp. AC550_RSS872 TaxID=2823689 RepID=UPI001C26F1E0|nr:hypothetical protein [Streptomyces sp. AC550_RSS872]
MTIADGCGIPERLTRMVEPIRIHPEGRSGRKTTVPRRQLTGEQRKLTASFLAIGEYGAYPAQLRNQFDGAMRRFRAGAQWRA